MITLCESCHEQETVDSRNELQSLKLSIALMDELPSTAYMGLASLCAMVEGLNEPTYPALFTDLWGDDEYDQERILFINTIEIIINRCRAKGWGG
jgi:hypothetical protein